MNSLVGAATPLAKTRAWAVAVLIVAAAAAYANSFHGAFQFDDIPAILENPTLRHLWPPSIPLGPPTGGLTVSGRPILNSSLALNYAISGYNPWSYHAFNLLIHIGAALALFGVVRRTLARMGSGNPLGTALAVAVIWAVHPLTTEAVTYVVQRAESLMALFYLLTLYCFIRSVDAPQGGRRSDSVAPKHRGLSGAGGTRPPDGLVGAWESRPDAGIHRWSRCTWGRYGNSTAWRWLSAGCCWLGMGTKEVMVSAPVAVLLYDRIFVAKSWSGAWRMRRLLYLALAASWIPLLLLVEGTGWDRGGTFGTGVSWIGYWSSQGEAIFRYLGLSLWPHPLVFDYGPPSAPVALAAVLAAFVLAGFGFVVAGCARGRPWAFPAGCFFLVLAPTSVLPADLQFAAEHRMYLPLAAVLTAGVLGLQAVASRLGLPERMRRPVLFAVVLLAVILLGTATAQRNRVYADELTLWMDTVAKRPGSAVAQANAGKALLERGRLAEGMACCLKAVALDPNKPVAHYNLGLAFEAGQNWSAALTEFVSAADLNPKLYLAEFRAGRLLARLRRPVEAESFLRHALSLEPGYAEARAILGEALAMQGRPADAVVEFEHSLRLNPNQPEVEFNLGISLARLGRLDDAVAHYATAVRIEPTNADAQLNLGVTLAQLGRLSDALPALQAAVQHGPGSPEAHENLATVLDQLGRTGAAVAEFRTALRLRPGFAEAHYNLGNALLHAHDLADARFEFAEALRLRPDLGAAREMLDRLAGLPADR